MGVDIVVERNKPERPCRDGDPHYDQRVIEYLLERIGCKPPYWNSSSSLNSCTEQKQLQEFSKLYAEAALKGIHEPFYSVQPPCRSLERIQYDLVDVETPATWKKGIGNVSVGMIIDFKEFTYKEITKLPGMNLQEFIGKLCL